jgi:hypothetical protein
MSLMNYWRYINSKFTFVLYSNLANGSDNTNEVRQELTYDSKKSIRYID